ncbi:3-hydroxyacyl-CoA dehydrogenase, partial [Bordetella trematum]
MTGKVAIVTGGAGAIGKGVALGLAAAGAKVVVNDLGVGLD